MAEIVSVKTQATTTQKTTLKTITEKQRKRTMFAAEEEIKQTEQDKQRTMFQALQFLNSPMNELLPKDQK